jgi:hypothetical protein
VLAEKTQFQSPQLKSSRETLVAIFQQQSIFMRTIYPLLAILSLTSCKAPSEMEKILKNINRENTFFEPSELGSGGSKNYFLITAKFSECGEFGGHDEGMKIYCKYGSDKYKLDYFKTQIHCDSFDEKGNLKFDTIETKTIELNKQSEKAIVLYLQRLTKSKIISRFPGHAGNSFEARKSDSTFVIQLYDGRIAKSLKNYNKLVKDLKL